MLSHPFEPVFNEHSEILILGTFPSVKSRENEFYYGHPQNRFWKVLAAVCESNDCAAGTAIHEPGTVINAAGSSTHAAGSSTHAAGSSTHAAGSIHYSASHPLHTATIAEKKAFLLQNHIALWDVISTCNITGSADATITNATPNDIASLLKKASIRKICCNGTKSWELFQKHILPTLKEQSDIIEFAKLPSTSPANAAWSLEKLVTAWKKELSGTER